jgi:hypothetical protein
LLPLLPAIGLSLLYESGALPLRYIGVVVRLRVTLLAFSAFLCYSSSAGIRRFPPVFRSTECQRRVRRERASLQRFYRPHQNATTAESHPRPTWAHDMVCSWRRQVLHCLGEIRSLF